MKCFQGLKKGLLFSSSLLFSTAVFSAGFQLPFYSISDLGNAFAGASVLAGDATTNYGNSAGDILIENPEISITASAIAASLKFNGSMSNPGLGSPISETGKQSTHPFGILPTFHYVVPLTDKIAFGISLTAPFGLSADYHKNSVGRYNIYFESAVSEQLTPSVAFKLTDKLAIGMGPDLQYFKTTSRDKVRTEPFTFGDSIVRIQNLQGVALGYHAGLIYEFTPQTRVGANYRSKFTQHLKGQSEFDTNGGVFVPQGHFKSNNTKVRLPLPPNLLLGAYHAFNPHWSVMATAIWSGWDVYKENSIVSLATIVGPTNSAVPTQYNNTWEIHAAANYRLNDKWLFRVGSTYIEGATNKKWRDLIYADNDSISVAAGANYRYSKTISGDFGYMHTYMKTARINTVNPVSFNAINGNSKTASDVVGLQLNVDFV